MMWLIKNILMKDYLFREIHDKTQRLQPDKSELHTVWERSKSGNITEKERQYLEAFHARQMRIESLQIKYLETCYEKSKDLSE